MGATIRVSPTGTTVTMGENTAEAARQAAIATAAAATAAADASALIAADRAAAAASASAASGSATSAATAATSAATHAQALADLAVAGGKVYATKALATADVASVATNAYVMVLEDESLAGERTIYRKESGALVFKVYAASRNYRKTWFVDPVAGNDGNAGTAALPFLTFTKAVQASAEGDLIRGKPRAGTVTVKEDFDASAYTNREFRAPGYVFNAYNAHAGAFTLSSGNLWSTTISHLFGGVGVRDTGNANKVYTGLFGDDRIYRSIEIGAAGITDVASAKAYVAANPFTYFVEGSSFSGLLSNRVNGWAQGNHTYWVNPGAGINPSARTWKAQQRAQPRFGTGWTLGAFTVFGGRNHNGVEMMDANLDGRIEIWYPACHGSFVAGVQGIGPIVRGRNPNASAGYAFHCFNGGARKRRTYLQNPQLFDYTETLDNAFGGHGSGQGNDIIEMLEVDDLYAVNINGIGGSGETTYGNLFRRMKVYGCASGAITNNTSLVEPQILHNGSGSSSLWAAPAAGQVVNVYGGSSVTNPEGLWANGSTTGTINFFDHKTITGGERVLGRWWSATAGTFNFTRCLIQAEGGGAAGFAWGAANGSTATLTDSAAAGVTWPTATTFTRTQRGGNIGLTRGPDGLVAATDGDRIEQALGEAVLGVAWPENTSVAYALTNKGVYLQGGASVIWASPRWAALAAYSLNGCVGAYKQFVGNWFVAFGPNSTLLRYGVNDGVTASPTVIDTSAVPGKNWTAAITGGTDGKIWLLASDGSITECDVSTPSVTARTSGVTYPLTGGVRNGAVIIATGSDAVGSAGTAGGAVVSSDTGATWAATLAAADAAPAGIGAWAVRAKAATFVNGVYCLLGARGMLLTSTTGLTGSWTSRGVKTDAGIRTAASDPTNKRIVWGGDAGLGPNYRGGSFGMIDASAADPANWTHLPLPLPVSAIGPRIQYMTATVGPNVLGQFIVSGQLAQVATAEDPRGPFRRADWPRPVRTFAGDDARTVRDYLAAA